MRGITILLIAVLLFSYGCSGSSGEITGNVVAEEEKIVVSIIDKAVFKTVGESYREYLRTVEANGEFLVLTLSVYNLEEKPVTIWDSDFKLIDPKGGEYFIDYAVSQHLKGALHWKQISPSTEYVGRVIFDVPSADWEYELKFREDTVE